MQVIKVLQLLFLIWLLDSIQNALGQPLELPWVPPKAAEVSLERACVSDGAFVLTTPERGKEV